MNENTQYSYETLISLMEILNMKRVGKKEVYIIENFLRENVDSSASICNHCPGQIRFGHKRVIKWAIKFRDELIDSVFERYNEIDEEKDDFNIDLLDLPDKLHLLKK